MITKLELILGYERAPKFSSEREYVEQMIKGISEEPSTIIEDFIRSQAKISLQEAKSSTTSYIEYNSSDSSTGRIYIGSFINNNVGVRRYNLAHEVGHYLGDRKDATTVLDQLLGVVTIDRLQEEIAAWVFALSLYRPKKVSTFNLLSALKSYAIGYGLTQYESLPMNLVEAAHADGVQRLEKFRKML